MVKGLPITATDEAVIAEFWKQNAVKGKSDTEIVKVVIGWDVKEYSEMMKKMRELRAKATEYEFGTAEYDDIQKQIKDLNETLIACAPDRAARLKSSGVVVVVFRKQADLRACLQRWTSIWARWTYSDGEDFGCLPSGNMLCQGGVLPKFEQGGQALHALRVERAANPGDIHWEELGKEWSDTIYLFMQTNAAMFLIVLCCVAATYGLNKWEENEDMPGVSAIPGIATGIVNIILMISARKLGDREFHETWTGQEFSQAAKMTVALLFNTAGVMLFANLKPSEWFQTGGLVDDAWYVLLFDAVIPPFIFISTSSTTCSNTGPEVNSRNRRSMLGMMPSNNR
jgi:hypothetical protein